MANDNDTGAETWALEQGWYPWGEWWKGTKEQLQDAGIGIGVSFPGEPGAPKSLVRTVDYRGVKVEIKRNYFDDLPHGVFWATSPYVERAKHSSKEGDEPPIQYAPGVILVRHWYGMDEFRGTGSALVACGLIEESQLPGQVGRGKVQCTFAPDGSARAKGQSSARVPGVKIVTRQGATRFVIEVRVSHEEEERRRSRYKLIKDRMSAENAEGQREREALNIAIEVMRRAGGPRIMSALCRQQ